MERKTSENMHYKQAHSNCTSKKKKYDELKVIMCHNKIFQLVCWLDGNAAHKSEGGGEALQRTW